MKVYIVLGTDGYESTWVAGTFLYKEKADKYAELESDLERGYGYHYYVEEQETKDDSVDLSTTTTEYFSYQIHLPLEDFEEHEDYNDDGLVKEIDRGDSFVEVDKRSDYTYIKAYHRTSYEEAKRLAIEEMEKNQFSVIE